MTATPLKAQLEAACKDLWWSSESDYPVEVVWYELSAQQVDGAASEDARLDDELVCQIAGCADDTVITSRPFDSVFDKQLTPKGWHTAEDKQQLRQLDQLKTLLAEAFSSPQIYRCGEIEITLCILGFGADGIVAGVKTCVVET